MKRSHLLFLTAAASLTLVLGIVISSLPERSHPVLAAPHPSHDPFDELLGQSFSALYQVDEVSCTLTTTTTDSLNNVNACPLGQDPETCADRAVTLADYNNLALVADGTPGDEIPAHTDWFRLDNAQVGGLYTMEALPDRTTNYNLGIFVYDLELNLVLSDANPQDKNRAQVVLLAANQGPYFFQVTQISAFCQGGTYRVDTSFTGATPTPTEGPATPSPTPPPARASADECEPNGSLEDACVIPVNADRTFNFVPPFGEGPDNDFYKVWVKPNLHYRCQTSDLAPGVDPNMIVFTGPSWDAAIGGNDDIEPCNFNSAFTYFSNYSGWLYLLIGTGDRTPSDIFDSNYTLRCDKSTTPFLATSTPPPTVERDPSGKLPSPVPTATATPTPTEPESPVATPSSAAQSLSVRRLAASTAATPHPRFVPVSLLVYYDANGDGQRGAGEGIAGVSARAYEAETNELLAQDYTDAQGNLTFSVSARGAIRLDVPFLSLSHLVVGDEATLQVRIPPQPGIGGAP